MSGKINRNVSKVQHGTRKRKFSDLGESSSSNLEDERVPRDIESKITKTFVNASTQTDIEDIQKDKKLKETSSKIAKDVDETPGRRDEKSGEPPRKRKRSEVEEVEIIPKKIIRKLKERK